MKKKSKTFSGSLEKKIQKFANKILYKEAYNKYIEARDALWNIRDRGEK